MKKKNLCQRMLVSIFMSAKIAIKLLNPNQEIVVSTVPMEARSAHLSKMEPVTAEGNFNMMDLDGNRVLNDLLKLYVLRYAGLI